MFYFVYLIKSHGSKKNKTYVGYSKDLTKRLSLHNSNKGAKATKGYKWKLVYKKKFTNRSEAMSFEYKLKKNQSLRKKIILNSYKSY